MRRRFLMGMVLDKGIWENYSYIYLYHSLIPQTIDSKNVLNKARLCSIEGNSEVVNQLITDRGSHPSYQSWTIDNSAGSSSLYATQQWNCDSSYRLTIGHRYLLWFVGTINYSGNGNIRLYPNVANQQAYCFNFKTQTANIITINSIEAPSSVVTFNTMLEAGTTLTVNGYLCFKDLDQQYPFDTPTTLTDVRVQNILAQGYIPHNTGEIKDTLISELEAQPYNLFDGEMASSGATKMTSVNFTPIRYGQTYTIESQIAGQIHLYDENKQYFDYFSIPVGTRTLQLNAYYVKFVLTTNAFSKEQLCFHLTGTRTGYAPYQAPSKLQLPAPLQIGGVNTAHNTFDVTNTGFVFTKKMAVVDLGSLAFSQSSQYGFYSSSLNGIAKKPNSNSDMPNIICDKLFTKPRANTAFQSFGNMAITFDISGDVDISYTSGVSVADFKTAMSGVPLKYELATPQVITIPKKHLGVVDLGSLTPIVLSQGTSNERVYIDFSLAKTPETSSSLANIYCEKYMTASVDNVYSHTNNNIIAIHNTNGGIYIYSSELIGLAAQQIQAKLLNVYLWYETEDEVSDFTNSVNIQSGGTLNGNMFIWVKNQLVSTANKSYTNTQTDTGAITIIRFRKQGSPYNAIVNLTLTNAGETYYGIGVADFTGKASVVYSGAQVNYDLAKNIDVVDGHYYLFTLKAISLDKTTVGGFETDNCEIIDLTLGFGAGNEPTDINDYRIQKILNEGYIPTDTTGTNESVGCEVLPNVEMEMKCK